jgi:hypothetical protein
VLRVRGDRGALGADPVDEGVKGAELSRAMANRQPSRRGLFHILNVLAVHAEQLASRGVAHLDRAGPPLRGAPQDSAGALSPLHEPTTPD